MKRFYSSLAIACLLAGTLWAADDPFCGKWKLNMEKSKFAGEQTRIEDLGGNKYKWTSGNVSDTITADGTDQPVRFGRTISIAPEGANNWKMVIKKDGKVLSSMTHTVSEDGKTQTIKGTETKPDGTSSDFNVVEKRVGSGSGWGGTWESTDVKFTSADEWDIEAYEEKGPTVAPGSTSAGKRVNPHTLEVSDKVKGEVMDHTKYEVSQDGKTLTLTIRETGQPKALTIVYDKM